MHRRPILPEPVLPDPKRWERMRAKAGILVAMLITEERQDAEAAVRERVQELARDDARSAAARAAAKLGILDDDRGGDGPAMVARRGQLVPADVAGTEYLRTRLDGPLAGLSLSPRQREAAAILADLWRDALPAAEMPGSYGGGSQGGQRELSHDQYLAAAVAWRDYRAALELLRRVCGDAVERAVRLAVVHREPALGWRVARGLSVLADEWRLPE
ncbi:hypothetical protein [Paracraurococcus lichenis]|uniref:Uncharacterized protein n=1 Tax=Paracraurococcus lichenis TaxID=3064888 RepID=A0ABT9E8K8_9PROT|nr:hypothetical protein [Paracraurococcus sp. LOR1-02]MDO9712439.1 hypothetical protein [Paracraurococcus sp. LOR1-02]